MLPPRLLHFEASSIVKDIDTESVYVVNFTIPTWSVLPNPYSDPNNYSRIFIEFPTEVAGKNIFHANLGGYSGQLNERVGCSFVSGSRYMLPEAGKKLECRLIPGITKTKIEITNHAGFTSIRDSLALYIYKIKNPGIVCSSFELSVSIHQTHSISGYNYLLFHDTYTIFLDPHLNHSSPPRIPSINDPSTDPFFDPVLDVGDYGAITLTATTITGNSLVNPYFVIFQLPSYLTPEDNQVSWPFSSCTSELCLTAPEIHYVMVKTTSSPVTLKVYIKNYPIAASQSDSLFEAIVIEEGRYTGKILYNISAAFGWQQLRG